MNCDAICCSIRLRWAKEAKMLDILAILGLILLLFSPITVYMVVRWGFEGGNRTE